MSARADFAYRGYFVQWVHFQEKYAIKKDGFHIGWAASAIDARRVIDGLTT